MLTFVSMTVGGVRGWNPLGEGVMEDLPWTLSLRSRVTTGQGCNQGDASPTIFLWIASPLFGVRNDIFLHNPHTFNSETLGFCPGKGLFCA